MNIHVSKILGKIEEELVKAKNSQGEHDLKERMRVIHSLTELILDNDSQVRVSHTQQVTYPSTQQVSQAELQKMMGTPSSIAKKEPTIQSSPLQEEDGNGDSLFDF
ncbi:YwdI family protein [Bacillus weihaiensis]|uniref:YwdI family protein n=1 Tax=Bacillus weihaiensis TaxID=1547283 RepID=UPI002353C9F0|nr:YwdI family protein [Bacillus weihaiensis]